MNLARGKRGKGNECPGSAHVGSVVNVSKPREHSGERGGSKTPEKGKLMRQGKKSEKKRTMLVLREDAREFR